jgi:hypothetical protein
VRHRVLRGTSRAEEAMEGVTLLIAELFQDMMLVESSKLSCWLVAALIGWVPEGSHPDADALMMEVVAGVAESANEDGLTTAG